MTWNVSGPIHQISAVRSWAACQETNVEIEDAPTSHFDRRAHGRVILPPAFMVRRSITSSGRRVINGVGVYRVCPSRSTVLTECCVG